MVSGVAVLVAVGSGREVGSNVWTVDGLLLVQQRMLCVWESWSGRLLRGFRMLFTRARLCRTRWSLSRDNDPFEFMGDNVVDERIRS